MSCLHPGIELTTWVYALIRNRTGGPFGALDDAQPTDPFLNQGEAWLLSSAPLARAGESLGRLLSPRPGARPPAPFRVVFGD